MIYLRAGWIPLLLAASLNAQVLDNHNLTGKYYFRHIMLTTDALGNISDARSLLGAMVFDGAGHFTYTSQQAIGLAVATPQNGNGSYTMSPAGFVVMTNPQRTTLSVNARYGAEAIIGSSTEQPDNVFDFFIAIPAPTANQSLASLNGGLLAATLEFPSGSAAFVRNTSFNLQANGQGALAAISVSGHAANLGGTPATQTVNGASYGISGDGSGSMSFPAPAGMAATSLLLSGTRTTYISQSGNIVIGGSPSGHDLLIAVKALTGISSSSNWSGFFWGAGMRFEIGGNQSAYAGSLFANGKGKLTVTRRLHATTLFGSIDFTGVNNYSINANGSGKAELTNVALGASGNSFVQSAVNPTDANAYEIDFGVRMPPLSGAGVFLNPQGVVNGASFAPAGNSISPGEFITLFGSGLGPAQLQVATPPYPPSVGGVSVAINNIPAPVYLASDGQLNVLVPYGAQGTTARIVVNNNGKTSNAVDVPLAKTSPGVFSLDVTGTGPGTILHADFTLVNAASPAKKGETVLVFLTGLGGTSPAVADGTAGGSNPPSRTNADVAVLVGGIPADVSFAGLAPGFPGLYQLNVKIPATLVNTGALPLAIQTADSFHDQVDVVVQ